MKSKLLLSITIILLFFFPNISFGQAPNIGTQPGNQIVCSGTSVSFSVAATGTALSYQWRKGNTNLTDGGNISGSTTSMLTINPVSVVDASSDFNVIVSGSGGSNDTSNYAVLDVNTAPNITTQPINQIICAGDTVKFPVIATGFDLNYQWRLGTTNLVSGGNILDATAATLIIYPVTPANAATNYNVLITGGCPPNDSSVNVSLVVNAGTNISAQPGNQTVCIGSSASFSVAANGTNLTYQWMKGNVVLVNAGNISGVNTPTLLINPVTVSDTASNYNVVITGGCPPNDTSIKVSLRFDKTNIITQPSNQTLCVNGPASFSVAATGVILNYQWMKGNVILVNAGNISGVTTATVNINPATIADTSSFYHVIITGGCALNDTSANVSLKFNTAPNITTQPVNQTVCSGSPASFSVTATGTALSYQWMKGNVNLVNGGNISGVTTATLNVNPATISDTSSFYHVVITGACTPNDVSIDASLMINSAPNITIQPANQIVCAGSPASFSVAVTGATLTYQWMKGNVILVNAGNISGATTATLNINPATLADTSSFYHVVITGACAPSSSSMNVSLMIYVAPNITTQPATQTVCAGSPASFSVAASGTALSYQWMKDNVTLVNAGDFSGVTTATLNINPATIADTSSFYHVIISGVCALNSTSINVSLKFNAAPIITTQSANQTICSGSAASFSVAASGTALSYQWMKGNVNLVNGGNISGANTATLNINPATIADTSSFYHVVITGACAPSSSSMNVSLLINLAPNITTQPANQTVCSGSPASFSVAATGTALSYQWMKGNVNLVNAGNVSGVTTATLSINPATLADTSSFYHVVITGACAPSSSSINVSLLINTAPNITTQPANQTVCAGSPASFSVTASGTALSYQWMKGNINLINGGNISGVTTATLNINPATIADTSSFYHVLITGVCTPNSNSINVSMHVSPLPIVTAHTSTTTVCSGSSVIFTGNGATSYVWTGGVSDGIAFVPPSTNTYTVTGTNANNCSNTATITVNVTMLPVAVPISNSPVCIGSSLNLNTPTVSGATYNWTGPNGFASTSQNPSLSSATLADAGTYSLAVSNNGCSSYPTIAVAVNNCAGTDLSVIKTVNNTYPIIGNNVVFTIVASNKGPNNATGVLVGDTLQSGYTYISSTTTKGTFNPATGIWNIDTLNKGTSAILTVTVKVNTSGNYVNTAAINGNAIDTNVVNNISSVETFPTDFFIPEGFSPNGDGINDQFVIRGIENYTQNTFTVFNRWGDKVFGASPYINNWDGKSITGMRVGGDVLPVGTYFYILDLGDGSKAFKGSIYLNR